MRVDDNTELVYKQSVSCTFTVNFTLDKLLKYVKLNLYLKDGTLIQELNRYKLLEPGIYDISIEFEHIFEVGTTFIAKLEDANGILYHQQQVK